MEDATKDNVVAVVVVEIVLEVEHCCNVERKGQKNLQGALI